MPVLMNIKKQVWVGGAFRAGPLLLGTHNLSNIFSKNKIQNGGFYLALTIRPGRKYDRARDGTDKDKRRQQKNFECPVF